MGVGDQESAENGVHDRVKRASSEGSDGERDQAHTDESASRHVSYFGFSGIGVPRSEVLFIKVTNLSKVQW